MKEDDASAALTAVLIFIIFIIFVVAAVKVGLTFGTIMTDIKTFFSGTGSFVLIKFLLLW
jgi:hypothetical protein